MGATAQTNERLAALTALGTSVWLDLLRRSLVETGELRRLSDEDSLRGVTSNPSIFEKAILGSQDYDDQIAELARAGHSSEEVYEALAIADVQMAADVLEPVWEATDHADGFVSLEVSPGLANDGAGTLAEARTLWQALDRPNVMIKIPGTDAGLSAIEQATAEGINVNVTLLFAVEAYERVAEAYIRGLEKRLAAGGELDVHSVASFFVSRVDTEVDKRLEALGRQELAGTAAIANARRAYQRFQAIFHGDRFAALREAGAPVQRPLWASTGVKNPHYRDTLYVEELAGAETVNTMPMATLLAVADHGQVGEPTVSADPAPVLAALEQAGIDMQDVTAKLLQDGIVLFADALQKLLAGIEERRAAIFIGRPPTISAAIPPPLQQPLAQEIERAASEQVARRVWKKDESLWGGPGVPEIANRLGWLTIADAMKEEVGPLREFAQGVAAEGFTDVVLLGMGGSSLAPEVLRRSYAADPDAAIDLLRLHVLDTTDAAAVLAIEHALDLDKTLFLVSSKSGGTIEPNSLYKHFRAAVEEGVGGERAGAHFAAITDPGSSLVELARTGGFRHTFLNDPDIGGRYSALSFFGLVPAALMGADLDALLDRAGIAEQACISYDSSESNSGLWLGAALGALAKAGHDKLTFVVEEPIASFGLWAEQLVAESTGKQGRGILPVADEPLGAPEAYGSDRVFVHLRHVDAPDVEIATKLEAIAAAGHPVLTLSAHGAPDLGRIFFFSEFATAVAGWSLEINPFDQPNVQQAKDATNKVLAGYEADGALPQLPDADDEALRALLAGGEGAYLALQGFVPPSEDFDAAVAELRGVIRDATRMTTTFGYGPRYLHSTGQFHKGGPPVGRFLQLLHDGEQDAAIPGAPYGFTTLKNAQAIGDFQTLREVGRPIERVRLAGPDAAMALRDLTERVRGLL